MQALEGIRILDLSKLLPGDYCGMILADMGAEVIKIEDPRGGDPIRQFQPQREGLSYWHLVLNRNKKSVTLDIRTLEGKEALLKMVEDADVLLESFRPGLMESLGLPYEALKEINPKLIYCSISGFGKEGFGEMRGAHDINIVGLAGLKPNRQYQDQQVQISGITAGNHGAMGILAALHNRTLTGKGQHVDISMLRSTLSLLPIAFSNYWGEKDTKAPKYGTVKPNYRTYGTLDNREIVVGAFEMKFWDRLCELLEFPEGKIWIHDPSQEEQLTAKMEELFVSKTLEEWLEILKGEDICVSPVHTMEEIIEGGILTETGMMEVLQDEKVGKYHQINSPIVFSNTPNRHWRRAPFLGEDNE